MGKFVLVAGIDTDIAVTILTNRLRNVQAAVYAAKVAGELLLFPETTKVALSNLTSYALATNIRRVQK